MNLDNNKKFDYEAYVYNSFDDEKFATNSSKQMFQQLILFFSRLLIDAETRY